MKNLDNLKKFLFSQKNQNKRLLKYKKPIILQLFLVFSLFLLIIISIFTFITKDYKGTILNLSYIAIVIISYIFNYHYKTETASIIILFSGFFVVFAFFNFKWFSENYTNQELYYLMSFISTVMIFLASFLFKHIYHLLFYDIIILITLAIFIIRNNILIPLVIEVFALILVMIFISTYVFKIMKSNEQYIDQMEEANKKQIHFISMVTHDLKNFLSSIKMANEGILSSNDINEFKEYSIVINDSVKFIFSLINDLHDFAKIEEDKLTIEKEDVVIFFLIENIYNILKKNIENRGLDLKINCDKNIIIKTDPLRLQQILLNLIGNSIKFTEKGYIEISVEKKENFVYFSIKDTGIGIKEEDKKLIFSKYNYQKNKYNSKYGGSGLGLYICKALVNKLGGEISFESEENKGTTFYFTLPIE